MVGVFYLPVSWVSDVSHLWRLGLQRMTLESGIPSDGDGQMRLGLQRMTPAKLISGLRRFWEKVTLLKK
jgi:hypothetical protein